MRYAFAAAGAAIAMMIAAAAAQDGPPGANSSADPSAGPSAGGGQAAMGRISTSFSVATVKAQIQQYPSTQLLGEGALDGDGRPYLLASYDDVPMVVEFLCDTGPDDCPIIRFYSHFGNAVTISQDVANAFNTAAPFGYVTVDADGIVELRQNILAAGVSDAYVLVNMGIFATAWSESASILRQVADRRSVSLKEGAPRLPSPSVRTPAARLVRNALTLHGEADGTASEDAALRKVINDLGRE